MIIKIKKNTETIWGWRSVRSFTYAVLFRILVCILSVCIMAMFGEYQEITLQNFLDAWTRGDSIHYLNIAQYGYSGVLEKGEHLLLVFFPLYPWVIRIVSLLVHNFQLAGILTSIVCFGIGNVYLDKIVCMEYNEEVSAHTRLLYAIYPFAFFFGSIHTESMFFAILTAFFYYLRVHKWWKVAITGFLACLTKVQGILLAFSVIAELMYYFHGLTLFKEKRWKLFFQRIIYNGLKCMPMIGGVIIYLYINYMVEGDFFRFMYYQNVNWSNRLCPVWHTITYLKYYALEYVGGDKQWVIGIWLPEFILFFVYIIVILYGFIKKQRIMYQVYFILFFLLTYSSTWLISGPRYSLSALPLFLLGGSFLSKHKRISWMVYVFLTMLMLVYMIGFYQGKPIY